MKTFQEFILEAQKRVKVSTRYHGTTQSRANSIKSSGFRGSDGSLGYGVYSTPSKKSAEYHAKRHSNDSDKPAIIQLKSVVSKKKNHHIHARNMYDNSSSKDPLKKDVAKRITDRAQANLGRGKDVTVTNITDKQGKAVDKEVIQSPERATKDIIKNPQPTIKSNRPKRTKTQPKKK